MIYLVPPTPVVLPRTLYLQGTVFSSNPIELSVATIQLNIREAEDVLAYF